MSSIIIPFLQESVRAVIKGSSGCMRRTDRPNGKYSNSHSISESGSNIPESDTTSFASEAGGGKPWKKHNNRNKKEKIRRTH